MPTSENSKNPSSWRYKMGVPRPQCCYSLGKEFQHGPASFFAFKSYTERHGLDRVKRARLHDR